MVLYNFSAKSVSLLFLNFIMDLMIKHLGWFFMGVSWLLEWPIKGVRVLLQSLPWVVISFVFCLVAFIASGWRLAVFAALACFYMVVIGYWSESMNTLSLVVISVPMAVGFGFVFGVWAFNSKRAEKFIMPIFFIFQSAFFRIFGSKVNVSSFKK